MLVDEALLERHRSFEDTARGVREQFVRFSVGPGNVLGVLTTPLAETRPVGFVVCHSFGMEQVDLQSLEATLCRRLAASGFPVLRFQCLGYGDSEPGDQSPSVLTQVRDTEAAVRRTREMTGVQDVGLIGARFGGTVAALVADRMGAHELVTIAPLTSGSRFMNDMLRSVVMREMVKVNAGDVPTVKDLRERLDSDGMVDVRGFPLTSRVFDDNNRVDLLKDLTRYAGRSLVLQVSRGDAPQSQMTKLADRLRELGGDVTFEVVTDSWAPALGQPRFSVQGDGLSDVLGNLYESAAGAILAWFDRGSVYGAQDGVAR